MADPTEYESLRLLDLGADGPAVGVVLAANPSPMTLQGTNTWLLWGDPASDCAIVVDPGPDDERHLAAVAQAAGSVELILLTHRHADHSAGAGRLSELTGAAVAAADPAFRRGGPALVDGATIEAAGVSLRVLTTPGHTADSVCLVQPSGKFVLTGDTILGRGTTVVAHPSGVLADYLNSLDRLAALDNLAGGRPVAVLPGHGPDLPDLAATVAEYRVHRQARLAQVRQVLDADPDSTPADVLDRVYRDVAPALRAAAELSVRAQLAYLRS